MCGPGGLCFPHSGPPSPAQRRSQEGESPLSDSLSESPLSDSQEGESLPLRMGGEGTVGGGAVLRASPG